MTKEKWIHKGINLFILNKIFIKILVKLHWQLNPLITPEITSSNAHSPSNSTINIESCNIQTCSCNPFLQLRYNLRCFCCYCLLPINWVVLNIFFPNQLIYISQLFWLVVCKNKSSIQDALGKIFFGLLQTTQNFKELKFYYIPGNWATLSYYQLFRPLPSK